MWLDDFRARVEAHPARTAIVAQGRDYSYRELWERSAAAGLAACRDQPGPRHWIAQPDPLAYVEAVIGAWIHGKVPVVTAPAPSAEVRRHLLERIAGDPPAQADPDRREALILATSGSTGLPKMTVLSHGHLSWRISTTAQWYDLPAETHALVAVAIHTHASLVSTVLLGLACGWTLHLFPGNTPGGVLQAHIRAHGIAVMNAPASFFRLLFQYGSGAVFPSLRRISVSGESASQPLLERMHTAVPAAEISIVYGMTESGRISVLSARDSRAADGGCGMPLPDVETRMAPIPGVSPPAGELLVRGPAVMLGYLEEDGSYAGLDAEGFLQTGDMMRIDPDGCLRHLGRMGGLVKVGGLMVNPREVEQVLQTLPGVADAMCWAEPHELLGYAVAALVVPLPGAQLDERALRRACHSRMEKHKVPRTVTIVDRLPENPSGKRSLQPAPAN